MLYLCLVCKFIPMSGLQCYIYVGFANLYLLLLYNIIPTSGMVTSVFGKFDFRHIIPTSGLGKTDIIPSSVISTYGAPEL